jgi:hypothetical protein
MISYAYDTIARVSPLGLFGMVLVLEGTSITNACAAASGLQKVLHLPDNAFTYLQSHGELDQDHMKFFENLMNRIVDPADQKIIEHSARVFYRLYADVIRSIDPVQVRGLNKTVQMTGSDAA